MVDRSLLTPLCDKATRHLDLVAIVFSNGPGSASVAKSCPSSATNVASCTRTYAFVDARVVHFKDGINVGQDAPGVACVDGTPTYPESSLSLPLPQQATQHAMTEPTMATMMATTKRTVTRPETSHVADMYPPEST